MQILGVLNNKICILIEGARIIVEIDLNESAYKDLVEYGEIKIFNNWNDLESFAYGS